MRRQCGKVSAQGVEMLVMIEHVEDGAFAPQCRVTLHEPAGAFLQPRMLELHRGGARIRRVGRVDESRHLGDERRRAGRALSGTRRPLQQPPRWASARRR